MWGGPSLILSGIQFITFLIFLFARIFRRLLFCFGKGDNQPFFRLVQRRLQLRSFTRVFTQDELGKRIFNVFLDRPVQGPGAELRIVPLFRNEVFRFIREFQRKLDRKSVV